MTRRFDALRTAVVTVALVAAGAPVLQGCSPDGDPPAPALFATDNCASALTTNVVYPLDDPRVTSLVADSGGLYWTDTYDIWMLLKGSKHAILLDDSNQHPYIGPVVDGDTVFWASDSAMAVRWSNKTNPFYLSFSLQGHGIGHLTGLAVGPRDVYVSSLDYDESGYEGLFGVRRMPLLQGGPIELLWSERIRQTSNYYDPQLLGFKGGALFWVNDTGLFRLPSDAMAPTQIAMFDRSMVDHVIVDEGGAYWTSRTPPSTTTAFVGLTFGGDATETITVRDETADGIALDSESIYWTETFSGQMFKANRTTHQVTTAVTSRGIGLFTMDDENFYWVDECSAPIIRFSKK